LLTEAIFNSRAQRLADEKTIRCPDEQLGVGNIQRPRLSTAYCSLGKSMTTFFWDEARESHCNVIVSACRKKKKIKHCGLRNVASGSDEKERIVTSGLFIVEVDSSAAHYSLLTTHSDLLFDDCVGSRESSERGTQGSQSHYPHGTKIDARGREGTMP
jgi:hypothetical protein